MKCDYCGREVRHLECIPFIGCACEREECQKKLEADARSFEEETDKPFYPEDVMNARHLNILMWRLAKELRPLLMERAKDPSTLLHWLDMGLKLTEMVIHYIDDKYPERYFHIVTRKTLFSGGQFEMIRPVPKELLVEALAHFGIALGE